MSRLSVKFDETIRNTSGQGATRKIVTLWRHTVAHLRYVELLDLGALARAKIGESVVAELADGFTRTEDFEWSEITRISYEYRAIGLGP